MKITKENRDQMPARGPGKLTTTVRETFAKVFNKLQSDPEVKLSEWAKKEPTEFYRLASKLIPTEIQGNIQTTVIQIKRANRPGIQPTSSGAITDIEPEAEV